MQKISLIGLVSLLFRIFIVLLTMVCLIVYTWQNGFKTLFVIRALILMAIFSVGIFLGIGTKFERTSVLIQKDWFRHLLVTFLTICAISLVVLMLAPHTS